ncbi:MAG: TetR/AcrR family transcriptional regulator [Mariprofundaceae bacterium]|nr:TetR/AcrR family transcriptional regulator [Mariprofundaceae bacterium]
MSKNISEKSMARQQQIIDVAETIIANKGLNSLTARHIATEMSCAVGSLYRLFENLDAVIIAVNLRTLYLLEKNVLKALDSSEYVIDGIKNMSLAYIDFVMEHKQRWHAVMEFHFEQGMLIPASYVAQQDRMFHLLEMQISILEPTANKHELMLEARALWGGVEGLCALALRGKLGDEKGCDIKAVITVLLQRFLDGRDSRIIRVKGGYNVT